MTEKEDYLRVTSILQPFSGIEFVPAEVLEPAAERGTAVHKLIEGRIKGFATSDVPEELEGYLASFELFWDDNKDLFENGKITLEKRLYCDKLEITGKVDLIVENEGKCFLFDWKTSRQKHKAWDLQASAYFYLASKSGYENMGSPTFVKLSKGGKKPTLYKSEKPSEDWGAFYMCLHLYKLFKMDKTRRGLAR